jgi:AmmeMemoRadiSam system protein B
VEEKDREMLQLAEKINPEGFYRYVQEEGDRRRVCGFPSIYALLSLIKAREGKLLNYLRWQDTSLNSFVTFASMVFYE